MLVVFHFLFRRLFPLFFFLFKFRRLAPFCPKKKIVSVFWLLLFLVPLLLLQFNSLRVFNNKFPLSFYVVPMRCAFLFAISQFQIARRCMYLETAPIEAMETHSIGTYRLQQRIVDNFVEHIGLEKPCIVLPRQCA